MQLLSWIAKIEFSEVLSKLNKVFLNDIGEGNDILSSLKLSLQRWKNILLKLIVLEGVCFTIFFVVDKHSLRTTE